MPDAIAITATGSARPDMRAFNPLADRIRYSECIWRTTARLGRVRAALAGSKAARLGHLARAYRAALAGGCPEQLETLLRPWVENPDRAGIWREQRIGWHALARNGVSNRVTKGLVLKAPGPGGERGVMLLSFEYNWLAALVARERGELLQRYTLLCATAWSPPAFTAVWAFAHLPGADVYFTISNPRDPGWLQRFQTGTKVLPLSMSHWINPADFSPRPRDRRSIDLLMVANWGAFKRHWALFRVLPRLPRRLRVVLVGQPENGRTLADVRREAADYGVEDRVEFHERLEIAEVNRLQCDSRAAVILSKREGSCVAVAEALFADTPVALLRNAHIGSLDFINPQTGLLLDETCLAEGLVDFLVQSESFTPRAWAEKHISCQVSTQTLNNRLRDGATREGRPWTRDTCVLGWRPNPCYLSPTDATAFDPAYAELKNRHGLTFAVND